MARRSKPTAGFRSKFEKEVADKLKKLKIPYEYESDVLPYVLEKKYIGDFCFNDIILEAKGVLLPPDIEKMLAVRKQHPDKRIIFIFMNPHRKIPRRKATHAEWAERTGFEWTDLEHLKELLKTSLNKSKQSRSD